jgi:hypothetical protein
LGDSRGENRFRPLSHEHWINPVLYLEFENINGADKTLLEIVNHDGNDDLTLPNRDARFEKKREIEAKLILGSYYKGGRLPKTSLLRRMSSTHRSSSVLQLGSAVHSRWKRDPTDATFVPRIFKWA